MNRGLAAVLALSLLATGASAAPRKTAGASTPATQLMQNCDAHKFETVVTATVDGQPRQSKVKLCGVEGQTDADWIKTLRDAIRKLDADKEMNPAVRTQIKTAIDAEIARLTIEGAVPGEKTAAVAGPLSLPPPRRSADTPISRDFSALPPLPTAPPPPPHLLGPAVAEAAPAANIPAVSSAPAPPLIAAPKLSFACYSPGDMVSDAPCAEFDRETMLTIKAAEKVPAGVALRFVRNGESRADVDLATLTGGKSLRMALPRDVCSGFGAGRLELQVIANGAVVSSDGPYALRCY